MGYFDGLVDGSFKKNSEGKFIFYPWGIFGSGYILETEEQRIQIRSELIKMYIVVFAVIFFGQFLIGWWLSVTAFPLYAIWYYFFQKKISQTFAKSTEKLKVSEAYQSSAKSHNLITLIILEISSLIFVAIGIWMLAQGSHALVAFSTLFFFGLCSVAIGYMILRKIRPKS